MNIQLPTLFCWDKEVKKFVGLLLKVINWHSGLSDIPTSMVSYGNFAMKSMRI